MDLFRLENLLNWRKPRKMVFHRICNQRKHLLIIFIELVICYLLWQKNVFDREVPSGLGMSFFLLRRYFVNYVQNVLKCPKCPKISQNLSKSPKISHNLPKFPKISQNVQKCPKCPKCPKTSKMSKQCAKISQNLPQSPKISQNLPKFSKMS